jgi:hypothetical protein
MIRNGYHAFNKPLLGTQVNLSHPLAQGLDFAFLFNEGSGSPSDIKGGLKSVLVGGATWGGSRTGGALKFDGSTGAVKGGLYANAPTLTLACRFSTSAGGTQGLIMQDDQGGNRNYQFRLNGSTLQLILFQGGSAFFLSGAKTINDGTEHVAVVTYDGTTARLYVDGALDASSAFGITPNNGNLSVLALGAGWVSGGTYGTFLNGSIVWACGWRRALSAADLAALNAENYSYLTPPGVRRFTVTGGAAWVKTLSETYALTDSRMASAGKSLAETYALTDARVMAVAKSLVETLSLTDVRSASLSRILTETLSLIDNLTSGAAWAKILTETLAFTDNRTSRAGKGLVENYGLSDIRTAAVQKVLTETLVLTDARAAGLARRLAETYNLTDVAAAQIVSAALLIIVTVGAYTDLVTIGQGGIA